MHQSRWLMREMSVYSLFDKNMNWCKTFVLQCTIKINIHLVCVQYWLLYVSILADFKQFESLTSFLTTFWCTGGFLCKWPTKIQVKLCRVNINLSESWHGTWQLCLSQLSHFEEEAMRKLSKSCQKPIRTFVQWQRNYTPHCNNPKKSP